MLAASPAVPAAAAAEVSSAQLARLAAGAERDRATLARLRRVDRVDGRPADIAAALRGATGRTLSDRLATLAERPSTGAAGGPSAARARGRAAAIVAQRRFQPAAVPQPLRRPLEAVVAAVDRAVDWLAARLPGGRATVWALLAVPVALGAFLVVAWLARRRERGGTAGGLTPIGAQAKGPGRLEREADDAERRGELEWALRLRFQAGLLRLDRARAISLRPSLTAGEVATRLRSPAFDELRHAFDAVAYGGRTADPADVAAARALWPRVLTEVDRARTRRRAVELRPSRSPEASSR